MCSVSIDNNKRENIIVATNPILEEIGLTVEVEPNAVHRGNQTKRNRVREVSSK